MANIGFLQKFVNCGCKKFFSIRPVLAVASVIKLFCPQLKNNHAEVMFVKLGCKRLTCSNTLASLIQKYINYEQISFTTLDPGPKLIKKFTSVIYECS
jgi:hypothetical protein